MEVNDDKEQVEKEDGKSVRGTTKLLSAMTGPLTGSKDDGGATQMRRMINDVLVEPRMMDAPTKRRRVRARRSKCPKIQGTIKEYFAKIHVPKETSDGSSTVEGAQLRKRKGEDLLVEDLKRRTLSKEPLRLLMEDDEETCGLANSRTLCPIIWGAKSGNGRETDDGQKGISGNGLDLFSLAPMKEKLAGDWTKEGLKNI